MFMHCLWLFCATTAELIGCDRDQVACKPRIFTIWPFKKQFANQPLIQTIRSCQIIIVSQQGELDVFKG